MKPFFFVIAAALAGCVTKREMRDLPSDAGISKTYDAPFDKVKRACEDTLAGDYWKKGDSDKDTRFVEPKVYQVIGSQNLSSGTAVQRVRVRIENKETQCIVWVVVHSGTTREAENRDVILAEDLQKKIAARVAK